MAYRASHICPGSPASQTDPAVRFDRSTVQELVSAPGEVVPLEKLQARDP